MTVQTYEIYAVKYAGPVSGKLAFVLWMEGWDTDADRNHYLWAIKANEELLVVDTGRGARLATER